MRPTGVVLIAIYQFLGALFLIGLALLMLLGGSLPAAAGAGPITAKLALLLGAAGAVFAIIFAVIAVISAYGIWNLREWGRILTMALAVLSLVLSLPGLLLMAAHVHLFFGTYRLFRIAISILMLWYLMQPPIRALFQRTPSATPS